MEKIYNRLEELLSDILFCGLTNISADMCEKIKYISADMRDMGLNGGAEILDAFYNEIQNFRTGENDSQKASSLLFSLEFYMQNILNLT